MKHSQKLKRLAARIRAWEAAKDRQGANAAHWARANKKPGSVQQK